MKATKSRQVGGSDQLIEEARDLYTSGDYLEALEVLSRASRLNPSDPAIEMLRADILRELGRDKESAKAIDKAIELQADDSKGWQELANILSQGKRDKEALEAIDRAIKLEPNNNTLWRDRNYILRTLDEYEEALTSIDRAIELKSNDPESWQAQANTLWVLNRYESALEANDMAIKLNPNERSFWDDRADILQGMGKNEEALEANDRAMKLDPDNTTVLQQRIYILQDLKRYPEALEVTDRILNLEPNEWVFLEARAEILQHMGKYEEAIQVNDRIIELNPDDPNTWEQRESILIKLGRRDAAREAREKAIKLQFADSDTQERHAEIETVSGKEEFTQITEDIEAKPTRKVRRQAKQLKRRLRPPFTIQSKATSDMPTEIDQLGFQPLIEGLEALLNDEDTKLPLTIALTAPWGGGKSSIMRQLQIRLRQQSKTTGQQKNRYRRKWHTVRFEAWKYETCERLWAILAETIYGQVQNPDQMSLFKRIWFRTCLERTRFGLLSFLLRGLAVPALVLFVVTLLFISPAAIIDTTSSWVGPIMTLVGALAFFGAWAARFWGFVGNPFKRSLRAHCGRPKYEDQLGFTEEADRDVTNMIRLLTTRDDRALAIFVDDLDRCSSGHVVEIVEAINQIFSSSEDHQCVFVLGMDREAVAASIEVFYDKTVNYLRQRGNPIADDFGLRFLSKIVQLSVAIPPPDRVVMRNLLNQVNGAKESDADRSIIPPAELVQDFEHRIRIKAPANPVDVMNIKRALEGEARRTGTSGLNALDEAVRHVRSERFTSDSEDVREAELEILNFLDRNPRQVKRFDNAFRLQLRVASETPGSELKFDKAQLFALGKWVAIRLRWPRLAADADYVHKMLGLDLLRALEAHANNPRSKLSLEMHKALESYKQWYEVPLLSEVLKEAKKNRRLASLPMDSFLRVA